MKKSILTLLIVMLTSISGYTESAPVIDMQKSKIFEDSLGLFSSSKVSENIELIGDVKPGAKLLDVVLDKGDFVVSGSGDCLAIENNNLILECKLILNYKPSGRTTFTYRIELDENQNPASILDNKVEVLKEN